MLATLGDNVVATLVAPSVLPAARMGARIETPYTRAIAAYWREAAYDPVAGLWTVVLDSPPTAGEWNLVWRTGDPEPPEMEVFIPLSVTTGGVLASGGLMEDPPAWAPSVDKVAEVTPAYTVGGFDDDAEQAGGEQLTYTDDTSPSRTHVEGLILGACQEVAGRVGVPIPERRYGLARQTAVWHTAAQIAATKMPAGTDDARGEYSSHIANFRASLDELIKLSRMPTGPRLH